LLLRKKTVHFFRSGGDIDIHTQIEAARALQFVPDQQGNLTRSKSVDQDLGWSDYESIGYSGVGYRDTLQSLGRVDQEGLAHHHPQRRGTRRDALVGRGRGRSGGLRGGRVVLVRRRSAWRRRVLRSRVRRRSRCRSGPGVAFWSNGAREHGCRAEK